VKETTRIKPKRPKTLSIIKTEKKINNRKSESIRGFKMIEVRKTADKPKSSRINRETNRFWVWLKRRRREKNINKTIKELIDISINLLNQETRPLTRILNLKKGLLKKLKFLGYR
jgi:hypothetical protein